MRYNNNNKALLPAAAIAAVCLVSYLNSLANTFAWDDIYLVVRNPYIKGWHNIGHLFTSGYWESLGKTGGLYRPVTMLSFLVEHSIAGLSPIVYHLDNVLLHIACSVLVFLVAREVAEHRHAPLIAALLFAAHPVHSEAVAWVSGRAELLAALFFLLAFLAFVRREERWRMVSAFFFLLGLLSKETAAMLPAVVFLYMLLVDREKRPSAFARALVPYAVVLAVYMPVRLAILSGHVGPKENIFQYVSAYGAFLAMSKAFMYYVKLMLFPVNLAAAYLFRPPEGFLSPPVVLFWSLAAALAVFSPRLARKNGAALFFMLWFFVALVPVANILPSEILMSERALYLPSVGLCALAGMLGSRAADFRRLPALALVGLAVLSFTGLAVERNGIWRDDKTVHTELAALNRRAISEFPRYVQLYNNLADSSIILGRYNEAKGALEKAVELEPGNYEAHFKLASVYRATGRPLAALEELKTAASLGPPSLDEVYGNMAAILYDLGRKDQSRTYLEKALMLNPKSGRHHLNKGYLLMDEGQRATALAEFKKAGELDPELADAFFQQGILLGEQHDYKGAINAFVRAVRIEPGNPRTHLYLGAAYELAGKRGAALSEVEKALALKPDYPEAEALYKQLR